MIRFGDFQYDRGARRLTRDGKQADLSPKAFDLLGLLLESRPRVLGKAELRDRLWPGTFVGDSSLAKLVSELRKATGDTSRAPRFIRTVHRHGYAFCGPAQSGSREAPGGASHRWCLLKGDQEIGLMEGDNLIGRSADCLVRIDSARVSRHHARIRVTADAAVVEDLGSKNGTFLRGHRLPAPATLIEGDEIRVGPVVMVFRGLNAAVSTTTE